MAKINLVGRVHTYTPDNIRITPLLKGKNYDENLITSDFQFDSNNLLLDYKFIATDKVLLYTMDFEFTSIKDVIGTPIFFTGKEYKIVDVIINANTLSYDFVIWEKNNLIYNGEIYKESEMPKLAEIIYEEYKVAAATIDKVEEKTLFKRLHDFILGE